MITTPESNIVLSEEQDRKLEIVRARLSNLEAEITIATKNLSVLNKDIVKAKEEKVYIEQQVETLRDLFTSLEKQRQTLNESTATQKANLIVLRTETANLIAENEVLFKEHKDKEDDMAVREEKLVAREQEVVAEKKNTSDTLAQVNVAKDTLLTAINSITW